MYVKYIHLLNEFPVNENDIIIQFADSVFNGNFKKSIYQNFSDNDLILVFQYSKTFYLLQK